MVTRTLVSVFALLNGLESLRVCVDMLDHVDGCLLQVYAECSRWAMRL